MIVCENRALSEYIRDRYKRTETGWVQRIVKQTQCLANALGKYPLTVLLLRALMHEFARVSQAIIHGAVQFKKSPAPKLTINGAQAK